MEKVEKFKKPKSSPRSKKVRLKSGREITVTTTKNSAKGRSRRRKRGGVSVPAIGLVPLGGLCDVNEDCQLGLQCSPDPSYIIDTIKTCRNLNRNDGRKRRTKRKRRKSRRKSRRRKRRKTRRKSRRRKRRTKRRR